MTLYPISYHAFAEELEKIAKKDKEKSLSMSRGKKIMALSAGGLGGALGGEAIMTATKGKRFRPADNGLFGRVLARGPKGVPVWGVSGMKDNAFFRPGPDGTGMIGLGKGNWDYAPVVSHEMGHADLHRNPVGKLLQNRLTSGMGRLGVNPLVGALSGGVTGSFDNETARRLGRWAPAILSAPMLAYEGGATLSGLNRLRRAGATKKQLLNAAAHLGGAWGTYAGSAALNTGIAHATQHLATLKHRAEKVRKRQEAAKLKKGRK